MDQVTLPQIAAALRITKRSAERRSTREHWRHEHRAVRGGLQRVYQVAELPTDVRAAIALASAPRVDAQRPVKRKGERRTFEWAQIQAAWERFGRSPTTVKKIGIERAAVLHASNVLVASGLSRCQADESVAAQHSVSVATIYRWRDRVGAAERMYWPALLVPQWTGRTARAEMPEEAWDLFKADWLRLSAPQATAVYARIARIAEKNGWRLPSQKTFERRMDREVAREVQILARQGEEELARCYPAQERDRSVFAPLEAVNADGHRFDVFARWPCGTIGRPLMVAFQDLGVGKFLSYRVGQSESADLVRLAYADMVEHHGPPDAAYLDNGRGFAAKMLTGGARTRYRFKVLDEDPVGMLKLLGTEPRWTSPYHGQSKPIERAFKDLCERVAKHPAFEGAYTGNSPTAKPENYGSRAIPIDVFLRVLDDEIREHNARRGRESKVCAGRSFDQAFADGLALRPPRRRATDEQLRQLWLSSVPITANQRDGSLAFAGNRYWSEALSQHAGTKLVMRFDPDALHARDVYVYSLAGDFLCRVQCIATVGFADTKAAAEHAASRNTYKRAAKALLKAERRKDASDVAAALLGTDALEPAPVARPIFREERPAIASSEMSPHERRLDALLERRMQQLKESSL